MARARGIPSTRDGVRERLKRLESSIHNLTTRADGALDEFLDTLAELSNDLYSHDYGVQEASDEVLKKYVEESLSKSIDDNVRRALVERGKGAMPGPFVGATLENIDEMLANLVADRATLKRDLIFTLSAIDQAASTGIMNAEAWFSDKVTWPLKEGLIRRRWRGAHDEESFFKVFNEAIVAQRAYRTANRDKLNTVLNEELDKIPARQREAAFKRFQERIASEYKVHVTAERVVDVLKPFNAEQRQFLLQEALKVADSGKEQEKHRLEDKRREENLDEVFGPSNDTAPGWFERDMMRWGRVIWEDSYALGLGPATASDEAARIAETLEGSDDDRQQMALLFAFGAAWAVQAFQRMTTTHTFAAALMCSDASPEALEGLQKQWRAFVVIVPNGLLPVEGGEISRILIAAHERYAEMTLVKFVARAGSFQTFIEKAIDLPTLLTASDVLQFQDEDGNLRPGSEWRHARVFTMAKRLVAGLLLSLQTKENFKEKLVAARYAKGRKGPSEPEHRVVHVGRPLQVDCREEVRRFLEGEGKKRKGHHTPPSVITVVRGHFRRQPVGVGRLQRKIIWIEPFFRNVIEGVPILVRPKAIG